MPYGRRWSSGYSRRRYSPSSRSKRKTSPKYRRARKVGRAATRQAYSLYKGLGKDDWKAARDMGFDMTTLTGQGDYSWNKGYTPGPLERFGTWAGRKIGQWGGRVTGLGDYTAEGAAPSPMPSINPPMVRNKSDRSVVISHREYIGDVVTSGNAGGFSLNNFQINPGNPEVFPWLSAVAQCFQEYELDGCLFEFRSMSADALNSTNTALGQVICATNYNVNQPNWVNKFQMENTEFGSSCKPSVSFMHPIECDKRQNVLGNLYIAPGGVIGPGQDPKFYNHANFQLATNGFQGSSVNIGELWVTYEVTLRKPIQPTSAGQSGDLFIAATGAPVAVGSTSTLYLGGGIWNLTPTVWEYPPNALNPTGAQQAGLQYWLTGAGTGYTLSGIGGNNDTSLVGRCFQVTHSVVSNTGGTIPLTSTAGSVTFSGNVSSLASPMAPIGVQTVNSSTQAYQMTAMFKVTGGGPVQINWPSLSVLGAANVNVTPQVVLIELPSAGMGQ